MLLAKTRYKKKKGGQGKQSAAVRSAKKTYEGTHQLGDWEGRGTRKTR